MNIIAHSYLSGTSSQIMLGNFIGDYVKGSDFSNFPPLIQKGIIVHRNIDYFTDHHPIVTNSKSKFYTDFHKYSGIFVDIFYDHFLVTDWKRYCSIPIKEYTDMMYKLVLDNFDILPAELQSFVHKFVEQDWLSCYDSFEGLQTVLTRLSSRSSLPDLQGRAIGILRENYDSFRTDFDAYFPELIQYVKGKFDIDISFNS